MTLQPMRYVLDSSARRISQGTGLLGGSPFRALRLSRAGAQMLDSWLLGKPVPASAGAEDLRRRLVDAGLIHPVVDPVDPRAQVAVGFVIPTLDDAAGTRAILADLRAEFATQPIVVVDDGSQPDRAAELADIADRFAVTLVRHRENRGPAAARNTGWRELIGRVPETETVVFLDVDTRLEPRAIGRLLAHLGTGQVRAVAPRVAGARPRPGAREQAVMVAGYELVVSALDMGLVPALVRPGTRVSYVPAAALAATVELLVELDGFDEDLRLGEDVDLVWRADAAGHRIRYEPESVVHHRPRSDLAGFARQRFGYGLSAAALDRRHPGQVAPLELDRPTIAALVAGAVAGAKVGMVALGVASAVSVRGASRLGGSEGSTGSTALAVELVARARLGELGWAAQAATRVWAPLLLVGSRRSRRVLVAAWIVPAARDWLGLRPELGPVRFAVMRALDHGAYCAGVWTGAVRSANPGSLLPRVRRRP